VKYNFLAMKNQTICTIVPALSLLIAIFLNPVIYAANTVEETIEIYCSEELQGLADTWVTGINRNESLTEIKLSVYNKDETGTFDGGSGKMGLIYGEQLEEYGAVWKIPVARMVLISVIHPENPYFERVRSIGVSPERLGLILSAHQPDWGMLLDDKDIKDPVNIHWTGDEIIPKYLGEFIRQPGNVSLPGTGTAGDLLAEKVSHDRMALAFCLLSDIIDPLTMELDQRLSLVPIDVNSNNKMDYFENIYGSLNQLNRGVWIGKYPHELYGNVYLVAPGRPQGTAEMAFVDWILTGGQTDLQSAGYTGLLASETHGLIQELHAPTLAEIEAGNLSDSTLALLVVLGILALAGFVIYLLTHKREAGMQYDQEAAYSKIRFLNEESLAVPEGLFYDKTHTWTYLEKDGSVRLGIDDFLQHITGKITRVNLKSRNERIERGNKLFSIRQDGKQLDIYSPVSGTIENLNEDLQNNASLLNESPYSGGWVYIVRPDDWMLEIRRFFMAGKYRDWIKQEFTRLKDFLAGTMREGTSCPVCTLLQEGGEIRDHLMEHLSPAEWEDFQTGFLDTSI
jgi:glycine cleavage system H lipoate-binding protein